MYGDDGYRMSLYTRSQQVVCNALNFSDPRISVLLYSLLFVLAIASSIALLLSVSVIPRCSSISDSYIEHIQVRVFVGSAVAVVTVSVACSGIAIDLANSRPSKGRNVLTAALLTVMDFGAGLISRVPDELELIHRYA